MGDGGGCGAAATKRRRSPRSAHRGWGVRFRKPAPAYGPGAATSGTRRGRARSRRQDRGGSPPTAAGWHTQLGTHFFEEDGTSRVFRHLRPRSIFTSRAELARLSHRLTSNCKSRLPGRVGTPGRDDGRDDEAEAPGPHPRERRSNSRAQILAEYLNTARDAIQERSLIRREIEASLLAAVRQARHRRVGYSSARLGALDGPIMRAAVQRHDSAATNPRFSAATGRANGFFADIEPLRARLECRSRTR